MNDFFFDRFSTDSHERASRKRKAASLLLIPVVGLLLGLLTSVLFIPGVMAANAVMSTGLSVWDAIEDELPIQPTPQRSVILDRDGNQIGSFYSENRIDLTSEQISQHMKDAQVSIEDTRFYDRSSAVDTKAVMRALAGNVVNSGGYGGGSTLTQQYVKNVLLNNATSVDEQNSVTERSIARKVKEMKYAIAVEKKMSKDDILVGYLNIANYGDGAFGIGAAAQHYFATTADKLTIAQSATLAGIVKNPSKNPVSAPESATKRRNYTLAMMLKAERITQAEHDAAVAEPLTLSITNPPNGCTTSKYPYYCEQVRRVLRTDPAFGETQSARDLMLFKGGLTVHTTLDPAAMKAAQKAADDALGNKNRFATGIAVVQPGTGHVLAIAQNRTFDQTQVSYPNSGFQNGSTFKPITLAAALEDGWDIAATLDAPATITKGGKKFRNQSATGIGTMTAADALAVSSNTFFVKMETEVTSVADVQSMMKRLGMTVPKEATGTEAATTLGVYDTTPVEVANVYATFAAHGVYCSPTYVTSVESSHGPTMTPESKCRQELEPGVADTVANALAGVVDGPNERRTAKTLSIGRPVMGKTGTTTGNSAVWFAGGTPQYATAVWVGDPRGGFKYPVENLRLYGKRLDGVFGSTAAGPIWRQTMAELIAGKPVLGFGTPSTVSQKIVVPNVKGLNVTSAIGLLHDAGLSVTIAKNTSGDGAVNTVTAQTPSSGSALSRAGGNVELTLTTGSNTDVVVPS